MTLDQLLKGKRYLPKVIRDFDRQTELFQWIRHISLKSKDYGIGIQELNWVTAQAYTIDFFLWLMAKHGYTLQRVKKTPGLEFPNLDETLNKYLSDRYDAFSLPDSPKVP